MNGDETEEAAPESLIGLMDELVEPSEPPPVPLTPETWGWAALALILAALLAWLVWRWIAHHRANAGRRAALAELAQATTAAEVAEILRRAALSSWPREEVASLVGTDWIAFLNRTAKTGFPDDAGRELVSAPWRDSTAKASPALRSAAETWLRKYRVDPA